MAPAVDLGARREFAPEAVGRGAPFCSPSAADAAVVDVGGFGVVEDVLGREGEPDGGAGGLVGGEGVPGGAEHAGEPEGGEHEIDEGQG